jgi:hypothetical protein
MKQQRDGAGPSTSDFSDSRYDGAVRAKLGKALRKRHDLREPLAPRLLELLAQLDTSFHVRERREAKLYAEVDDCVATMVQAAGGKPRPQAPRPPGAFVARPPSVCTSGVTAMPGMLPDGPVRADQ